MHGHKLPHHSTTLPEYCFCAPKKFNVVSFDPFPSDDKYKACLHLKAPDKLQWCPFSNVTAPCFDQIYIFALQTVFEAFVFWELGQSFISFCEKRRKLIFAKRMKSESSL